MADILHQLVIDVFTEHSERKEPTWRSEKEMRLLAEIPNLLKERDQLREELQRLKDAVAEQLHYDAKATLSGTPEERMRLELHQLREALEPFATEGQAIIDEGSFGEPMWELGVTNIGMMQDSSFAWEDFVRAARALKKGKI